MQAYQTQSPPSQIKINFSEFNQSKGGHLIDEDLLDEPI